MSFFKYSPYWVICVGTGQPAQLLGGHPTHHSPIPTPTPGPGFIHEIPQSNVQVAQCTAYCVVHGEPLMSFCSRFIISWALFLSLMSSSDMFKPGTKCCRKYHSDNNLALSLS